VTRLLAHPRPTNDKICYLLRVVGILIMNTSPPRKPSHFFSPDTPSRYPSAPLSFISSRPQPPCLSVLPDHLPDSLYVSNPFFADPTLTLPYPSCTSPCVLPFFLRRKVPVSVSLSFGAHLSLLSRCSFCLPLPDSSWFSFAGCPWWTQEDV